MPGVIISYSSESKKKHIPTSEIARRATVDLLKWIFVDDTQGHCAAL